jgi:hypothetical protein
MRRKHSKTLAQAQPFSETVNPMEGVANLADVMLVFACGLMLALIINWNVDVGATANTQLTQGEEVTEMGELTGAEGEGDDPTQYERLGEVYRDPATGQLYMVTTED